LYLKDVVIDLKTQVKALLTLMQSAEKYQNVLLPGYTFTNRDAILFGMWFSAYAETLIDDIDVKCCSK
jgi:argininosuccinate lyase